ncbi:MAG: hypothetical protein L0221_18945, partial [Chloroflexi bacterium]|nr:hypothetical protein [Chloroflexota bacterium]
RLGRRLARRATASGLHHAHAFAGFDEGGTLELPALVRTIDRLAATGASTAELGCHPGEGGDPALARYRWGYRWSDELDALVSPAARAAVAASGFTLGTYGDVAAVRSGPS